jgi:hypothetical protein
MGRATGVQDCESSMSPNIILSDFSQFYLHGHVSSLLLPNAPVMVGLESNSIRCNSDVSLVVAYHCVPVRTFLALNGTVQLVSHVARPRSVHLQSLLRALSCRSVVLHHVHLYEPSSSNDRTQEPQSLCRRVSRWSVCWVCCDTASTSTRHHKDPSPR